MAPTLIAEAHRRLHQWADERGFQVNENRQRQLQLRRAGQHITIETEAIDVARFTVREHGRRAWDLLIGQAFLDLIDMPTTLPGPAHLIWRSLALSIWAALIPAACWRWQSCGDPYGAPCPGLMQSMRTHGSRTALGLVGNDEPPLLRNLFGERREGYTRFGGGIRWARAARPWLSCNAPAHVPSKELCRCAVTSFALR
jgi:hypothetical protein